MEKESAQRRRETALPGDAQRLLLGALVLSAAVFFFLYRFWGFRGTSAQVDILVAAPCSPPWRWNRPPDVLNLSRDLHATLRLLEGDSRLIPGMRDYTIGREFAPRRTVRVRWGSVRAVG